MVSVCMAFLVPVLHVVQNIEYLKFTVNSSRYVITILFSPFQKEKKRLLNQNFLVVCM
jgi:hypothetical protein